MTDAGTLLACGALIGASAVGLVWAVTSSARRRMARRRRAFLLDPRKQWRN